MHQYYGMEKSGEKEGKEGRGGETNISHSSLFFPKIQRHSNDTIITKSSFMTLNGTR